MDKFLRVAPQLLIALSLGGIAVQLAPISRNAEITYQCSMIREKPNEKMYNVALKKLAAMTGLSPWGGTNFCQKEFF